MADTKDTQKLFTQLQVLKNEVEQVASVNTKLDNAIDKLTDISGGIKSMLAVHEEKLSRSEKIDDVIFDKLKERAEEIDVVYKELQRDLTLVEKRLLNEIKALRNDVGPRIGVLERWKWLILGGSIVVGWILSKNFQYIMTMMNAQ